MSRAAGRASPGAGAPPWTGGWSLRTKLLVSYLAVVLLVAAAMLFTAQLAAPVFYRDHIEGMVRTFGGLNIPRMRVELEGGFNRAFGSALLVAGLVALPLMLVVSAFVSRRVVRPVQRVSQASTRIAAGHYDERLPEAGGDELGELTRNFNRMAEALEQTEARRVELIGTVAHELRTPLSGVRGYAEAMLDGVFGLERACPEIIREVRRLERLVDDLSLLTRAESGAIPVHQRPVALGALAREVCSRFELAFRERGLSLEVQTPQPVTVQADEDRLTQVLLNLLSNARRHTREGGVTVRVLERGGRGVVEVADTGEGIPAHALPHIFERFYRADPSRSRDPSVEDVGAGVGLTISKHLIEAMGGEIRVSSEPGRGSTFTLSLVTAASP